MTDYKFTADDVGCYLSGECGWYNLYRVVDLAVAAGWELDPADRAYVDAYRESAETMISPQDGETKIGTPEIGQAVSEIAVDATEYLQSVAAPGLVWEWDAGELYLRSDECSYSTTYGGEQWCDTHDSAYPCPMDEE